jgi:hypothetical protein
MNIRHITFTVGAAAGGMLAAAFLTTGAASAAPDDVTDPFGLTPQGDADLSAAYGFPPLYEAAYGTQTFDFDGSKIADFLTNSSLVPDDVDLTGVTADDVTLGVENTQFFDGALTNQEIVLPFDVDLTDDFTLQQGSVFDVANFGAGFGDVYVDLVGEGDAPNQIYDELITPFGNFDISPLVQGFDAAAVDADALAGLDPSQGLDFSGGADLLGGLF